jgi:hypothetical protein
MICLIEMQYQVQLNASLERGLVNLPENFFRFLLENNHDFEEILCIKIATPSNLFDYCSVNEFTAEATHIQVSNYLMTKLQITSGSFVEFTMVSCPPVPDIIFIRAFNDSFARVKSIKQRLEQSLSLSRILQIGDEFELECEHNIEKFTIERMTDLDGVAMNLACAVDTEVKIDFLKSKETLQEELKESQNAEAPDMKDTAVEIFGNRLGGGFRTKEEQISKFESLASVGR